MVPPLSVHLPQVASPSTRFFFFFTLVTGPRRSLSLKMSATRVYEPHIRLGRCPTRGTNVSAPMPLFRGSSRFESLILSHHSRFTCECNKEEINDKYDDGHGKGCRQVVNRNFMSVHPLRVRLILIRKTHQKWWGLAPLPGGITYHLYHERRLGAKHCVRNSHP